MQSNTDTARDADCAVRPNTGGFHVVKSGATGTGGPTGQLLRGRAERQPPRFERARDGPRRARGVAHRRVSAAMSSSYRVTVGDVVGQIPLGDEVTVARSPTCVPGWVPWSPVLAPETNPHISLCASG